MPVAQLQGVVACIGLRQWMHQRLRRLAVLALRNSSARAIVSHVSCCFDAVSLLFCVCFVLFDFSAAPYPGVRSLL